MIGVCCTPIRTHEPFVVQSSRLNCAKAYLSRNSWLPASDAPMAVFRADGGLLHLAGVLARWEGQPAATILTTTPNADVATLHNRMPVVLNDDDAATWVLEDLSLGQVGDFLKPCPAGWLRLAPASLRVNDVRNQGPELLDPAALPANYQMELIPPA